MKLDNIITAEKVIKEELQKDPTHDVFPITLIKFLLNRKRIVGFFEKVEQTEIQNLPSYIGFDHKKCNACINNSRGMLCRKHTSIERIMNTQQACLDTDTGVYLYMNEIFKNIDNKLAIIYTPHTKLIQGPLTEYKVKKISTISTYPPEPISFLSEINCISFSSNKLIEMYIKCWFNDEFSLITVPDGTNVSNDPLFCLVPNK
jgi:hypothetical protein